MTKSHPIVVLVDADACPVKEEIHRVAERYGAAVKLVSNSWMRAHAGPLVERVVVDGGYDAADDWIAERAGPRSIVVTADILLADRCLKAGARVIAPTGRPFTADAIGAAIADRAILQDLRASIGSKTGIEVGGPAPFSRADRSRFLQALDEAMNALLRS